MPMLRRLAALLLACSALLAPVRAGDAPEAMSPGAGASAAIPAPAEVLGFAPGEPGRLTTWDRVHEYLRRLDAASERVTLTEIGRTTENRPFLLATITSEANQRRLDELRRVNLRLADPRGLDDAEAARLLDAGRSVVCLSHGIHSTEVAGTFTALEVAQRLAASDEPRVREVLDETIVLLIPSANPDGVDKVARWAAEWPAFDGGELPFLYHHYAGHDNNRDWAFFALAETRLAVDGVLARWHPQLVHDVHQMGARGARFFVPPYLDPWEPNVDPALRAATGALGMEIAARLTAEGKPGVVVQALFDAWAPGRTWAFSHGAVRLLSETASARLAGTRDVPLETLTAGSGFDPKRSAWNHPLPWGGGAWRLRDAIDYQVSASWALLEHAARGRRDWLGRFLGIQRRASARSEPRAFVLPAPPRDPLAELQLLRVLRRGGVELHRARVGFSAGGRSFAAGSHVVLLQQPASSFAKTVLERQTYPELRDASGVARRPYDVTAHTLPLLLGVEAETVREQAAAELEPVVTPALNPGLVEGSGRAFALGHGLPELIACGRLLAAGVPVRWAREAFSARGRVFPAGSLLVPATARARLVSLAAELGVGAVGVDAAPPALRLSAPRIGLYQSWVASMDEGWTRYVLERDVGLRYTTLHDADVRAGRLRARFDAILLPDQPAKEIRDGAGAGALPPAYLGGLGEAGIAALRRFVAEGGTLVALNRASLFAIEALDLDVKNGIAGLSKDELDAPGSILRVRYDPAQPLAHGAPEAAAIWFEDSPAFEPGPATRVAARFADEESLLSGWLVGSKHLRGKAALVEIPLGRGRVVLFGFRPQYRAQSWGSYVPLLNALYLSAASGASGAR